MPRSHEVDGVFGTHTPDQRINFAWSWKPATGHANEPSAADQVDVEARSATRDEESHSAEFQSGVLLGVAAAAVIAAIQEFVNSAMKGPTRRTAS